MERFLNTPENEILARIQALKQKMEAHHCNALLLTHKPDIFYFSGTCQNCYLYVPLDQDPILFVKNYFPRAKKESGIRDIIPIRSVTDIPDKVIQQCNSLPKNCGLSYDVVPVRDFQFYRHLFPTTDFLDATLVINQCRQIKSAHEISLLREAADLSRNTFEFIGKNIKPGYSEMEFCGMYETYARKYGHSGVVLTRHYRSEGYCFHLLSGSSGGLAGDVDTPASGTGTSVASPHGAGPKIIQRDEPILIDFGTLLNGYHMDESRMFVMGTMEEKAMDACKASMEILYYLLHEMKPGAVMGDLFEKSVAYARKLGYEDQFLGLPDLKSQFIGHGIGLELVESPIISRGKKDVLEPGMVFAVEPKFIFNKEFCAGIESVIHVTENRAQFLSTTEHKIFNC